MSTVLLDVAGRAVERTAVAPVRTRLSRAAVDRLADLVGEPSPAEQMAGSRTSLDGLGERLAGTGTTACHDDDRALEDAGLLAAGLPTEVGRAVLAVWHSPALAVELEMLHRLSRGTLRVRSWHRNLDDWVVCLSTGDGQTFELAWLPAGAWWRELGRAARVGAPDPRLPVDAVLPDVVETPWDLLLATGEAVQRRRRDLLHQLVSEHPATTLAGDSTGALGPADAGDVRRWHEQLESTSHGRLHAAVMGRGARGRAGAGIVEWVLMPDGWRSLTPVTREGWAMVRVERVAPLDLPRALAVRAAAVTS